MMWSERGHTQSLVVFRSSFSLVPNGLISIGTRAQRVSQKCHDLSAHLRHSNPPKCPGRVVKNATHTTTFNIVRSTWGTHQGVSAASACLLLVDLSTILFSKLYSRSTCLHGPCVRPLRISDFCSPAVVVVSAAVAPSVVAVADVAVVGQGE